VVHEEDDAKQRLKAPRRDTEGSKRELKWTANAVEAKTTLSSPTVSSGRAGAENCTLWQTNNNSNNMSNIGNNSNNHCTTISIDIIDDADSRR